MQDWTQVQTLGITQIALWCISLPVHSSHEKPFYNCTRSNNQSLMTPPVTPPRSMSEASNFTRPVHPAQYATHSLKKHIQTLPSTLLSSSLTRAPCCRWRI